MPTAITFAVTVLAENFVIIANCRRRGEIVAVPRRADMTYNMLFVRRRQIMIDVGIMIILHKKHFFPFKFIIRQNKNN
jgi:hypothetical protein